ncbi:MAG: hypothetical protein HYX54_07570 [Chloroflexi bacterium]|nr:hypothetical protein [Chloroflexota bacterium]
MYLDGARREQDLEERELPAEAAWIAERLRGRGRSIDPATVERVLLEHRVYRAEPPPDRLDLGDTPDEPALRRESAMPDEPALRRESAMPDEPALRRESATPDEPALPRESATPGGAIDTIRSDRAGDR